MTKVTNIFNQNPILKPVGVLALFSIVCTFLLGFKIIEINQFRGFYLIWNLFLAWIPLFISLLLYQKVFTAGENQKQWAIIALTFVWLLFFPNAPYIISDIIHMRKSNQLVWLDALIIFGFATIGLNVGLLSLFIVQKCVSKIYGKAFGWTFISFTIFLSGFGIYLGRDLRYNSWDIITKPEELLLDCISQWNNLHAWNMSMAYAMFIFMAYLTIRSFVGLGQQEQPVEDTATYQSGRKMRFSFNKLN
ncbi:MAG: DUF1361 domain-containing protein [Flammeovirgaceae bacterium]|nr:DUF1361 domain-containing protein [Flammeovirgaceae bacterium]